MEGHHRFQSVQVEEVHCFYEGFFAIGRKPDTRGIPIMVLTRISRTPGTLPAFLWGL